LSDHRLYPAQIMGMIFDLDCPAAPFAAVRRVRPRKRRARIEMDTPIVPRAVAMGVWAEACAWLETDLPRPWINRLAARANAVYARNPRFQKMIRRNGNAGRDWLWAFARHWLAALIQKHRPALHTRLPQSYNVGVDFPIKEITH
jgi:hypothetical protein